METGRLNRILGFLVFIAFLTLTPDLSPVTANSLLVKSARPPVINLSSPKNPDDKIYLGVSGKGPFRVDQIKAEVVIIQILNHYCPTCQTTAKEMTELYQLIENNPTHRGKMKLIGIGAGNSLHEVEAFKETHNLPFPILPDKDFTIHKALGEVRTPHTIAVRIGAKSPYKVVYSQPGGFAEPDQFLELILNACGLKKGNLPEEKEDLGVSLAHWF